MGEGGRERERAGEKQSALGERNRERDRGERCVFELVYLHLRVTTNNEVLSLVI